MAETPISPSPKSRSVEEQRALVVAAARGWVGTPFHDNACVRGHGVDCARLLAAAYEDAGLIEHQEIATYSPQWMLHGTEPLFENYVLRFARRLPDGELPGPGDVVLYKVGRMFAHGAIVVSWPRAIIHAFKVFGFVAETKGDEADLMRRERRFYSVW